MKNIELLSGIRNKQIEDMITSINSTVRAQDPMEIIRPFFLTYYSDETIKGEFISVLCLDAKSRIKLL